jgi:hypothetical protein
MRNIHALRGIRNRDPNENLTAAELRFRFHCHQDRQPTYSVKEDGNYIKITTS